MAERTKFNRRDFLKIVGATTGVAAAGCAQELPEKIVGYVVQPNEVIPGVATWYAGSCNECAAGCGVLVRTREGRAVKIEGNPNHPVNKGGICSLGQSSIQSHYDPDRVREPLTRSLQGSFKPAKWAESLDAVATSIKNCPADKEILFLTGPLSGSAAALVKEFVGANPKVTHLEYELFNRDTVNLAAEHVFGSGVTTHFDFSKADVVASFGADYLETWLSPVEFSRQWATRRKPENGLSYTIHFEPRLSLTAANSDKWVKCSPGSEVLGLAALLRRLVSGGAAKNLSGEERSRVESGLAAVNSSDDALYKSGIAPRVMNELAARLLKAKRSLVVAGGSSSGGAGAIQAAELTNLINVVLGNVGSTVILRETSGPAVDSYSKLVGYCDAVKSGQKKLALAIVSGVNAGYLFGEMSSVRAVLGTTTEVVAIATQLDETAQYATTVLPLSTALESWGDGESAPGVFNLNQPSMQPLYETQSLGDTIIAIAQKVGQKFGSESEPIRSFHDYIKSAWKKRTGSSDFDKRWLEYVEKGGDWSEQKVSASVSRSVAFAGFTPVAANAVEGLKIVTFATGGGFDGRGANRAWLQEIPHPIANAVWGSWVEMSHETALAHGLAAGDVAQVRSSFGAVQAPVYISKHVAPNTLAIPLGQGHTAYGRYAQGVGINPIALLDPAASGPRAFSVNAIAGDGAVRAVVSAEKLVTTLGSDYQEERRGIVRRVGLSASAALMSASHVGDAHVPSGFEDHAHHGKTAATAAVAHESAKHAGGKHAAKHNDPLALGPQEMPPQMYKQMEHPLYHWGMSIDLASCTGCASCVTACYAENNIAIVGKDLVNRGREMAWIRIERYFDGPDDQPVVGFLPMFCQHCANAPCEPVCPVFATYHNEEGLNTMVYNRCVGTRYCSNNCSYKVRRFNWFHYKWPEPLTWQLNPDVTVREVGIMEKCSFCVQRIAEAKNNAKNEGRTVRDGEIKTACSAACPTQAMTFGNLLDTESQVAKNANEWRAYKVLDQYINTQPAVSYLARVTNDTTEA